MAIRKIARAGHPVLRQIAAEVPLEQINSPAIQMLIDDMLDTVIDANGAGLAAPQIHESLRIVLLELDSVQVESPAVRDKFMIWINPEISVLSNDLMIGFEGCLSLPGLRGAVARSTEIEVKAYDRHGKQLHHRLSGFDAVVSQHECDHLDGTLYIDRVEERTLSYLEEYNRYRAHLWQEIGDAEESSEDE